MDGGDIQSSQQKADRDACWADMWSGCHCHHRLRPTDPNWTARSPASKATSWFNPLTLCDVEERDKHAYPFLLPTCKSGLRLTRIGHWFFERHTQGMGLNP